MSNSAYERTALAWDPVAARLVTAHGPGQGELWDVSAPRAPRRLHPVTDSPGGDTRGVVFAAQGSLLFVAGRQPSTHFQDFTIYSTGGIPRVLSSKVLPVTQDRGLGPVLAVRPDGGAFAVDEGGTGASNVSIWDSADPVAPARASSLDGIFDAGDAAVDVTFSPDDVTMAVEVRRARPGTGQGPRVLYLYDVSDIRHPALMSRTDVGSTFAALAFSPNGRLLLGPGIGVTATLWDVRDATKPVVAGTLATGSPLTAAAFDQSGSVLATGEQNGTVKLWKVAPGRQPILSRTLTRRTSAIDQVSFDPRTGLLGVADDTSVQLWKTQ
ncbi:WD40 repeat domain-containing protein (plasmid) [Streptomyces sp. C1-1]|uniref:WD40 repeat domain-containing protein n=1 Tax=Streptomyces sp. C1-1 TaxID=3231173 RepID=UPI003CFE90FA